jgi:hypothetical protein
MRDRLAPLAVAVAWGTFCAAASAGASESQEGGPRAHRYFLLIESQVERRVLAEVRESVAEVARSHEAEAQGPRWGTYRTLTGGSDPHLYLLAPVAALTELDSLGESVAGNGEIRRPELLAKLLGAMGPASHSRTLLLAYGESISNPDPAPGPELPPFFFLLHTRVKPDRVADYVEATEKGVRAHKDHPRGLHWTAYRNLIGGDGPEFFYFLTLSKLGDLDSWPSMRQVTAAAYGEQEATRLSKLFAEVSEEDTSILVMQRELSRLPAPPRP